MLPPVKVPFSGEFIMAPVRHTFRAATLCVSLVCVVLSCDRGQSPVAPSEVAGPATTSAQGKIAFTSNRDGNNEIYVMNEDGTDVIRLTTDPAMDQGPAWWPDGGGIST